MRQTNRKTKRNQRNKKGKMLLLFNKIGKGCVLDKSRKVLSRIAIKFYHRRAFFIFLTTSDSHRVFHEITDRVSAWDLWFGRPVP